MSTWTCKRSIATLLLGVSLAGCSAGGGGGAFSFLDSGAGSDGAGPRRNVALKSADMARGEIRVVPPDGYCLDKRAHRRDFTVLARCDSLGGRGGAQDAALGMITLAVVPVEAPVDLEETLPQMVPPGNEVLTARAEADLAVAHLSGPVPDGADPKHWRGLAQVGRHLMSLVVYAPPGGAMAGDRGAAAMRSLVTRTQDASIAAEVARQTSGGTPKRKGLGGLLGGLLD